jgi:hypothetical protein
MAAGLGFKTFTTGEVLTAADTNGYLMQGVLVFASSAARASAITAPQEGQYSYLKDTNSTEYYDGAAWIAAPIGDITGVTAGTGISGGGTSGTVTITNSMATEITAKGDLIAGTGSATFDNLPVGTNGQTLVADSTAATGLKWETPAGGSTFVGVSVYGGTLSIPNNTSTAVVFNGENFDTSSFHDNVTNNTRITIPSGKTGYYQVNLASGTFNITSTGTFYFQIKKNGTDIMETPANKFFTGAYMGQGYAWIFYLTAGDYVQLYANQGSGAALDLYSNQANSNFSFSYLGA